MQTFCEYLKSVDVDEKLFSILETIEDAVKDIAKAVKSGDKGKAGSENVFGEEQLALDLRADEVLSGKLQENSLVGLVASEEKDGEQRIGKGEYAVCFDPLDGSSLVDVNLSVGTIVGVYKTESFLGVKGREQLASLIVTYGPRTTMLLTVGKGVAEFSLDEKNEFILSGKGFEVGEGKMFAPGNLRACSEREDYLKLTTYWIKNEYKLRYSGGMVPDVAQIILKGKGIFAYPGYSAQPDGKLRLLFECAPMAFLMEQAGGAASNGKEAILDIEVKEIAQKSPIFIGSKMEVDRCKEFLL